MDVTTFLEPKIDLDRLSAVLDGLGHEGRVHTTRTWSPAQQGELFEAAKGFRPGGLDFLVPSDRAPLEEVIHDGINSLPLFRLFQKRFTNVAPSGDPSVAGYNEQIWGWFTGPGYFIVSVGDGDHAGELVVDYRQVPREKSSTWPEIRANDGGAGALVYGNLIDYLRPISSHVSIGSAFKGGKHQGWFVLVRQDRS